VVKEELFRLAPVFKLLNGQLLFVFMRSVIIQYVKWQLHVQTRHWTDMYVVWMNVGVMYNIATLNPNSGFSNSGEPGCWQEAGRLTSFFFNLQTWLYEIFFAWFYPSTKICQWSLLMTSALEFKKKKWNKPS